MSANAKSTDDLTKPLGQRKQKKKKRFVVPMWLVSRSIAGVLGLCVAVLAGWILFVDEPFGGEPMAMVSADTRAAPAARRARQRRPHKPDAAAPAALAEGDKPGDRPSPSSTARPASGRKSTSARPAPTAARRPSATSRSKAGRRDRSALARKLAPRRDPEDRARRRAPVRHLCQARRSRRRRARTRRASRS